MAFELTRDDIKVAITLMEMSKKIKDSSLDDLPGIKSVRFSFPARCQYFNCHAPPRTLVFPAPHSLIKNKIIVRSRVGQDLDISTN